MNDKIHEINLKRANPDLVRQLELMLQLAKDGTIVGICGAAYYHDGATGEHWMEPPDTYNEGITADRMQGCLSRLSFMLHCRALGLDISEHITAPSPDKEPEAS